MIEIVKGGNNAYRFKINTSDGHTLLNSIDFSSEEEIHKTIKNLNPLLDKQNIFQRRTDHSGKFLFMLRDAGGKIIGNSLLYSSEAGMENGIKNLKNRIASIYNQNTL